MSSYKQRLSASVDAAVLAAAEAAVSEGRAANVSAWVNEALLRQAEHDRRMKALDVFLSAYENEHGVITGEEIELAGRRLRSRAVVLRGKSPARVARQRPATRAR
jgi:hypothetical protein